MPSGNHKRRTNIIFSLTALYTLTGMVWWTYSLINLKTNEKKLVIQNLKHEAQLAKWDCAHFLFPTQNSVDTLQINEFLRLRFPHIRAGTKGMSDFPNQRAFINDVEVFPDPDYIYQIENFYSRKIWGYVLEAGVFFLILGWGFFFLYRSLQQRLKFNRLQTNFLLAITHELKTPVASIKLALQTLIKREMLRDKQIELLGQGVNDTDRLTDLIDNVLMSTQMEGNAYQFNFERINFSELLNQHMEKFIKLDHEQHPLFVKIQPSVFVFGDPITLGMVIDNLVSNSMKYAPKGTPIQVSLSANENDMTFVVSDQAHVIPVEEREQIFQKFYRIGNEQTRSRKGTGLGLYIVKQVLIHHQGSCKVEASNPPGNQFVVNLKIIK